MIEDLRDKLQELATRKRAELESALEAGRVHDPFTIAGVVITWQAIALSAAVSIAASAASYALSRAFAPKPQKQTIGKQSGSLQIQNSEQGIMIPEIYGAGPTANIVAGASPTYQNLANATGGANGSITKTSGAADNYNAGASHNVAIAAGEDAFIRVTRGAGHAAAGFFSTASPTGSGSSATGMIFGVAWHPSGPMYPVINGVGIEVGNTLTGDEFTIELRSGRFHLYKGSAEVLTFGASLPAPTFPLYFGVIMYTTGAGVSDAKIKINDIGDPPNYAKGGIKVPAIIDWSSGIRKIVTVTQQHFGKGMGGQSQEVETFTYKIDLGMKFSRGPVRLLRAYANADVVIDQMDTSLLLSGIYDPTVGEDDPYDPELPPDPQVAYTLSLARHNGLLSIDGDGVGDGSIQGGGSNFAIYQGTSTQDPDPTEESDVDAKFGAGSTTAHRGKARIVFTGFDLSRYGGIVPNMTAAWEHVTLTTLDTIFASLCERVNVTTANDDYDFSGMPIESRGMVLAGRLFSPAEVLGSPDIQLVYNYFVTEAEGQIVGFAEGDEPEVTIADSEIGWMEGDADVADVLPEVETIIASEIALARQVDVKYIDLDKDWEPNTQSDNRQITEGVSTEVLEVQLALLASEARTAAQRKLYRDYVAGSVHKFTLPWTYLYLYPGYKITITRAEGFSHVMRLTSLSGGVGVLQCEGVAIETATFNQPAVGSSGPGTQPLQSVPAMTILSLLDTPLLRDGDETNNNGVGFYAAGTPRTGVGQSWSGFALYDKHVDTWSRIGSSTIPATIGTVVSAVSLSDDPDTFDLVGVITVDLYGTAASLASVTEADVLVGVNQAVAGEMVFGFVDAVQVADFPNRWTLSHLLNGQRDTEDHVLSVVAGMRFVLIDEAVIFVPARIEDLNQTIEYRGVTSGQSLIDAATVDFAWTGGSLQSHKMSDAVVSQDATGDYLVRADGHPRPSEEPAQYEALFGETEDWADEVTNTVLTLPMVTGTSQAALMASTGGGWVPVGEGELAVTEHVYKNNVANLLVSTTIGGTSIQSIESGFQRFDFEMAYNFNADSELVYDAAFGNGFIVALHTRADASAPYIDAALDVDDCPLSVTWSIPTDYYDTYPEGTVREVWRSYATVLKTREGIDPGKNPFTIVDNEIVNIADARPGPRYSFLVNGNEIAAYRDFKPAGGNVAIVKVSLGDTMPYPLRLSTELPPSSFSIFTAYSDCYLRGIMFGGAISPSTILSLRDQVVAFGVAQTRLYLRLRQVSRFAGINGAPLDVVAPPL